jgi:hypothetical protein
MRPSSPDVRLPVDVHLSTTSALERAGLLEHTLTIGAAEAGSELDDPAQVMPGV